MTDFVTCPFTGAGRTDLSSTNDSNGNAWVLVAAGSGFEAQISNNELEPWGNNTYRCGTVAPQADYSVIADVRQDVVDGTSGIFLATRFQSGAQTFYRVGIDSSSNVVSFYRFNAASFTLLKDSTAFNPTYQQTYNLELAVSGVGANVTLTFKIDGATVDSVTDSDASRITTAGYPGFQLYTASDGSGFFVDNFKGSYSAGGAVTKGYPFIGGAFARG